MKDLDRYHTEYIEAYVSFKLSSFVKKFIA